MSLLSYLSTMRQKFDRSPAVDKQSLDQFLASTANHQIYSDGEAAILDTGANLFQTYSLEARKKKLPAPSPIFTNEMSFLAGHTTGCSFSSVSIRAARNDVAWFWWNGSARSRHRVGDSERSILQTFNAHHRISFLRKKNKLKLNRKTHSEGCVEGVLKEMNNHDSDDSNSLLLVFVPATHPDRPPDRYSFHVKVTLVVKLRHISPTSTLVELVTQLDMGRRLPTPVMTYFLRKTVVSTKVAFRYYLGLLPLTDWTAEDGRAIGEALMMHSKLAPAARVRNCMREFKSLQALQAEHEFFEPFIAALVTGALRPPAVVSKNLCALTGHDGRKIGGSFAAALMASLTSEMAVDEFILKFPSLRVLANEAPWFRPLLEAVAQRLLERVAWGLMFRSYSGALISMIDLASDVYVREARAKRAYLVCSLLPCSPPFNVRTHLLELAFFPSH